MTQTGRGRLATCGDWLERHPYILPILILLVGAAFRYYNLNWDSGETLQPDERNVFEIVSGAGGNPAISWPASLSQFFDVRPTGGSPLNPHFFAYGTLPFYLLALLAGTISTLGQHIPAMSQWATIDTYGGLPLLGRGLSATFDLLSVFLLFLIGRRVFGYWTAVLGMALAAFTVLDIQLSHFYAVDTVLLPLCLLALLAAVAITQRDKRSAYIWGGIALGAALATKTTALLLVVPLGASAVLAAAFSVPWPRGCSFADSLRAQYAAVGPRLNSNLQWLLGSYVIAALTFVICEPYAILDRTQLVSDIAQQTVFLVTNNPPFEVPYTIQYANTVPYLYQLKNILFWDMGIPLGLTAIVGVVFILVRNLRRLQTDQAVLLLWVIPYFLFVGSFFAKFSRYMLPITPVMVLLGAAMLVWLARRMTGLPRVGAYGIVAAVLGVSFLYSLAYMNIYEHPNTRVAASQWIYRHIPPRSTIAVEGAWDDTLPLPTPAASAATLGYTEPGLDLYDPDGAQKAAKIGTTLAHARWLVMSSERMIGSIPKLPDRYAMTIRYYHLLFDGRLGYRLVRVFQQHPQLGPIVVHDYGADESFHVYDHPIVRIFKRVRALPASTISAMIMGSGSQVANLTATAAEPSLLLTPAQWRADQRGRTLDQMFPPHGFAMRHPIIVWLLLLEILGLLTFPLTFLLFRHLPDRGYSIGKTAGLLVWGYAIWIAVTSGLATYHQGLLVVALILLACVGGTLGWLQRAAIVDFLRREWPRVATGEAVFLAGFALFIALRLWYPDLGHQFSPVSPTNAGSGRMGEKQMELAFLNAIVRSHIFPPYDPFFAHGYINYYYYGFFLVGSLCKLAEIVPATGFNLAIATFFAMLVSNTFSVGLALTKRIGAGIVAACAVGLIGNLAGAWQFIQDLVGVAPLQLSFPFLGGLADLLDGVLVTVTGHATLQPFDFWAPTRIVPPIGVISEFPFFTYLFADLHPHLMAYPMTVAAAALGVNVMLGEQEGRVRTAVTLLAGAVLVGAIAVTNPWDYPTYLAVIAAAAVIGAYCRPRGNAARRVGFRLLTRTVPWVGALVIVSALLYLPFKESYHTVFATGIGLVRDVTPQVLQSGGVCPQGVSICPQQVHDALVTPLDIYLEQFGALLFPILSYLALLLLIPAGGGPRLRRWVRFAQFGLYYRDRLPAVLRAARVARRLRDPVEPVVDPAILSGVGILVLGMVLFQYFLLAFLIAVLGVTVLLMLRLGQRLPLAQLFLLALVLIPLSLSIATQIVFVKDWLAAGPMFRMNTIFKFYNQVWVLYAIAAAGSLYYFMSLLLGERFQSARIGAGRRVDGIHRTSGPVTDGRLALGPTTEAQVLMRGGFLTRMSFRSMVPVAQRAPAQASSASGPTGASLRWWDRPLALLERLPLWSAALTVLVAASLVYTFAGTVARETYRETWLPENSVPLTLNGMAFMKVAYPDDYAGISWLNAHVHGVQVVAEAPECPICSYDWSGRVAMFTGLADIQGGIHEGEQRWAAELTRAGQTDTLYSTRNISAAWHIIHTYGVRYIFVGFLETHCTTEYGQQAICYPKAGIAKFNRMVGHGLSIVFHHGLTTIYRVDRP